jgi:hypothetical protein
MNRNISLKDFLTPMWGLIIIGLVIGGAVGLYEMFVGHVLATTQVVVFTTPLVVYIWLALASTGISLILAYGLLSGNALIVRNTRYLLVLDIAVLLGGFVALATELGSLLNMIHMAISPNVSSPIFWMGAFYSIKLVLLFVKLVFDIRGVHGPLDRPLAWLTLVVAAAAAMTIGAVFGTMIARPDFRGAFASLLLVALAPASGAALVVMLRRNAELAEKLVPVFRQLAGVVALMLFLQWIYELRATTEGLLGWVNPLMFVLFAAAALAGVAASRVAGAVVMAASFWVLYSFIITGQLAVQGPMIGWYGEVTSFAPNLAEVAILILGVSVAAAVYQLGRLTLLEGSEVAHDPGPDVGARSLGTKFERVEPKRHLAGELEEPTATS